MALTYHQLGIVAQLRRNWARRNVQVVAHHSDPRTSMSCHHARNNLDRQSVIHARQVLT